MSPELGNIFSNPLTTAVYIYGSFSFLLVLAIASVLLPVIEGAFALSGRRPGAWGGQSRQ